MSALEEFRKVNQRRQELAEAAKKEALEQAEQAVQTLNELGFNYQLVSGERPKAQTTGARRGRKAGVRDAVLAEIKKHPNGISRTDLLTALQADDEKGKQSVSNAVAALKKADQITSEGGHYTAQG